MPKEPVYHLTPPSTYADWESYHKKFGFRKAIWSEQERHANSVQLIKEIGI